MTLLIISSFPMFGTMMGYAFPSILAGLLVTLAFNSIDGLVTGNVNSIVIFALASAFLFSTHPTFLPLWISSFIVLIFQSKTILNRIFGVALLLIVPLLFLQVLRPYLFSVNQYNKDHSGYASPQEFARVLLANERFKSALVEFFTLSYSVIVASFGLIGFFVVELYKVIAHRTPLCKGWQVGIIWIAASFAGTFGLTVISFGFVPGDRFASGRLENFIFLRYLEPFIPQILLVGLISISKTKINGMKALVFLSQFALVLIGGGLLSKTISIKTTAESTLSQTDFLKPFANSFWVSSLSAEILPQFWILAACIGILILLGPRILLCALSVILTFGFTLPAQRNHYLWFFEKYAEPTKLTDIIRREIPEGQCVAWDTQSAPVRLGASESSDGIQFGNVAFQLGAYDLRPVSQESWRNSCSGPLLTFNPDPSRDRIVVRDSIRNLYLVTHTEDSSSFATEDEFELIGNTDTSELCIYRDCFGRDFNALSKNSEVGDLNDDSLVSTFRAGVLFQTLGNALDRGVYQIKIFGSFQELSGVSLLAKWNDGVNQAMLSIDRCERGMCASLTLNEWVSDLQLILRVSQASDVEVQGLTVTY
jgi:hypothetical protein